MSRVQQHIQNSVGFLVDYSPKSVNISWPQQIVTCKNLVIRRALKDVLFFLSNFKTNKSKPKACAY
jgi:hypothetical protein